MPRLPGLSLREKLALLVTGLTALVLVVAGTLAFLDVRDASRTAAETRLLAVTSELVTISETGIENRIGVEQRLLSAPVIHAALREEPVDSAELAEQMADLGANGDLPEILVSADGRRLFTGGTFPSELANDPDPDPPLERGRAYGPLHAVEDEAYFWLSIPIGGEGDDPDGWVVARNRIGVAQSGGTIAGLIGNGAEVLAGQDGGDVWVNVGRGGLAEGPPPGHQREEPFMWARSDGTEVLAVSGVVTETPWVFVLEMPASVVLARPRSFLAKALAAGGLLVLLSMIVAWRLGSRLTDPLHGLAMAADAIAEGDYDSRVEVRGDDEVARLGRAFNAMTKEVSRADEALRGRLDEAKALAIRLQEANDEAERAREQALSANRAKSEFLATMSHELRTPINAVMGYVELMKAGIPDPPSEQQRKYLIRIDRSSRMLIALVNDVLDFSRIESGQMKIAMETGSAEEAVRWAVSTLEPDAAAKGLVLSRARGDDVKFRGDVRRVQQILLNLLSNALKFTPQGGSVSVSYRVDPEGPPGADASRRPWLRIDVRDTGIGIDHDAIETLFEPFVQGDPSFTREHGGIGLGLAISRRLASLMGGRITVESEPGRGSCFALWLVTARTREPAVTG